MKNGGKEKTVVRAALVSARKWFKSTVENDNGADYLNGEGRKDGGDGWSDAEEIIGRLDKALDVSSKW